MYSSNGEWNGKQQHRLLSNCKPQFFYELSLRFGVDHMKITLFVGDKIIVQIY